MIKNEQRSGVVRGASSALGLCCLLWSMAPNPAAAAEISGVLTAAGETVSAAELARGSIVYFRPDASATTAARPVVAEITMERKTFDPRVLVVPVGSTVRFPNRDPILHNVFSVSPGNTFDLGLYRDGESSEATFGEAGVVRVFCNVHHGMVSYVVVLDTPHYTRVEDDGRFRMEGLPEGPGELSVWNDRSTPYAERLVAGTAGSLTIELVADRPEVPRHANKLGKAYPRSARDKAY